MTKVSTNAGKHPYLRIDLDHLFDHMRIKEKGIKMDHTKQPQFNTVVETGISDKKDKKLFFKDIIIYNNEEYQVDYNAKDFHWMISNIIDPIKTYNLNKVANSVILHKKHNKT